MRRDDRRANARLGRRSSTLAIFSGGFALIASSGILVEAARKTFPSVFDTVGGLTFAGSVTALMGAVFYFRDKRVFA